MPITQMDRSEGKALGFEVSGDVTKEDYSVLTPAVASAVEQHGEVDVLLDLTGFHWEKVSAWGSDLHFGHEFHDKIRRMAIVGDKGWEKHLASLASPFYAKESEFFEDDDAAWTWLQG